MPVFLRILSKVEKVEKAEKPASWLRDYKAPAWEWLLPRIILVERAATIKGTIHVTGYSPYSYTISQFGED